MQEENNNNYKTVVSQRVKRIIELSGLELIGFAEFSGVSESHLYAILNENRELTEDIAERIGSAFDLRGAKILRINYRIPKHVKKSTLLNKFYEQNKNVNSYFINTRSNRKDSYFIEKDLLQSGIFDEPIYIWELKEHCNTLGKKYTSKRLSQILNYMVDTRKLKSKKKKLKLRNGKFGERLVDVFYIYS